MIDIFSQILSLSRDLVFSGNSSYLNHSCLLSTTVLPNPDKDAEIRISASISHSTHSSSSAASCWTNTTTPPQNISCGKAQQIQQIRLRHEEISLLIHCHSYHVVHGADKVASRMAPRLITIFSLPLVKYGSFDAKDFVVSYKGHASYMIM